MKKTDRVPTLGELVIAGWIRDDLAKQGIENPKVYAFQDNVDDPNRYVPFILLKDNGDNTVNGFTFPPETGPNRPPYGIENLPNIGRVPIDRLTSKPQQQVVA